MESGVVVNTVIFAELSFYKCNIVVITPHSILISGVHYFFDEGF